MYFKVIFLICSIQVIFTASRYVDRDNRVMGGETAVPNSMPHMIKLFIEYPGATGSCGGSLITLTRVLTAAHCFEAGFTSTLVIAGAHNSHAIEPTQQRRTVPPSDVHNHPQYSGNIHDIAYIVIQQAFEPTPYVTLIRYATPGQYPDLAGRTGTVAGWGGQGQGVVNNNLLTWLNNTIISNEQCGAWDSGIATELGRFCMATGGRDVCGGDSGGPLWITATDGGIIQVGAVQSGKDCIPNENSQHPGFYTRVDYYVSFFTQS